MPLYVNTTFFLIHPSLDRHSGCFHLLAVVNNVAVNLGVYISVQVPTFSSFGKYPEVELLDHMVILRLIF